MNLYKCKGYNARQFITEFSEQRLDKEQHQQAAGEVRNSQHGHTDKNVDTVESMLLTQEDKPQSHRTVREISGKVGGSIYHQFHGLFTKICVSSAT